MSDEFRVPKVRIPVAVYTADGHTLSGAVFLGDGPNGKQSVLDLLNGEKRFLVLETEDERVEMVRHDAIVWVSLADEDIFAEHGGIDPLGADLDIELPLRVVFDDGTTLDGVAIARLPDNHRRAQDLLNEDEPFVAFLHGGHFAFLNKNRIARATRP